MEPGFKSFYISSFFYSFVYKHVQWDMGLDHSPTQAAFFPISGSWVSLSGAVWPTSGRRDTRQGGGRVIQ